MSDIDMDDVEMNDSYEQDCDKSEVDELEELHNACVDSLEIKCCRIPAVITIPDLYTMYFERDDVTLPWSRAISICRSTSPCTSSSLRAPTSLSLRAWTATSCA